MELTPVDFKAVAAKGCFVYAYLRERDRTPYYIGFSSRARRPFEPHSVKVPQDKMRVVLLRSALSEEEAKRWEVFYIFWYGRIDQGAGILRNQTDGGDGNANMSPKTKAKISDAKRGVTTPAIKAAAKKRGRVRKPMNEEERSFHSKTLAAYSGTPSVVEAQRKTLLLKSYKKVKPSMTFDEWQRMGRGERSTLVANMKAAAFLEIPLSRYQEMSRGQRISATKIKKHALGLLGTRKTGSLIAA